MAGIYQTELAAYRQRIDRAGGDAGATAGTFFRINFGQWAATKAWCEANGAGIAIIATNAAFDAFQGQAGWADQGFVGPRRLFVLAEECERFATGHAIAAKGAFATAEINGGKSTVAGNNDLLRAGAQAVIAARTAINEFAFG